MQVFIELLYFIFGRRVLSFNARDLSIGILCIFLQFLQSPFDLFLQFGAIFPYHLHALVQRLDSMKFMHIVLVHTSGAQDFVIGLTVEGVVNIVG